jgi:pyruvate dehydrogenase E1 component
MGATAGRTTLLGEGLQHQDGHSLVLASTVPAVQAYDPAFAYEIGAIVRAGIHRMYGPDSPDAERDVIYYLTLYNENYPMPALPDDPARAREFTEGAVRGLYRFAEAPAGLDHGATILFSGVAHQAATAAAVELAEHYGVGAELWSATSYKLLREEALAVERHNRLHPSQPRREPLVTRLLRTSTGPITAVSDFMCAVPEMICRHIPDGRPYNVLGTDGMGRSDTREALRRHFEVDMPHVVVATLSGLHESGTIGADVVEDAIRRYGIDADAPDPYVL